MTLECFFDNPNYSNWAVAVGTLLLAISTIIFHFIGDSYTRLIKNIELNKFYNEAYNFLKTSFHSLGQTSALPETPN